MAGIWPEWGPVKLAPPPSELIEPGLRALKAVAHSDGHPHELEHRFLNAAQKYVLHSNIELDGLGPIAPDELAAAIPAGEYRERLVRAMILVAVIDGEATQHELDIIDAYSAALDVEGPPLRDLHRLVHQRFIMFRIDVLRRSFIGRKMKDVFETDGFKGLAKNLLAMLGKTDEEMAARYRALEECADGTLGREYARFVRDNEFNFPGEKGGPPEAITFHDCTHVLGGYGTSAEEEVQVAAFQSGYWKRDPFFGLLFVLAQFHLGVQITPLTEAEHMQADPELMLKAFARGMEVKEDLSAGWDPWQHFSRPVDELRAELNIAPR